MHAALRWLVPAVVGALVGAASYVVGSTDPLLTGSIVLSYAVLARLAIRHPDIVYEEHSSAWAVGKWSGLSAGFVLLVAFVGVGSYLPIPAGLGLSLQILVIGAGWAMWALGVAYARAKATA
jgi:hypothetical protein